MTEFISAHVFHIFIAAIIFMPFERVLPRNRSQLTFRKFWSMDAIYAVFGGLLIFLGFLPFITLAVAVFGPLVPSGVRSIFASQHIAVQVFAILIIGDLWYYFMHRMFHRIPRLWRLHAIHHSVEEMDWLVVHRVHPIDQILTSGAGRILPIILGFSAQAFAIAGFLIGWHALLKHSNVKLNFGILSKIIVSPNFHHWHHANQEEAYDKNFAGVFPIIDVIFGTALIREEETPDTYGIDADVPETFSQQLISPFLPDTKPYEADSISAE